MNKNLSCYRPLAGLLGAIPLLLLVACSQPVPASIRMMDNAEALWQANPVPSYHIIVDVDRPDDRRRNDLTVRQGEIVEATVSYWDFQKKRWEEPYDLNQEQAFPFTVPGLFEMVRGELRGSNRADIRVVMDSAPAFPHRIILGPVWQDLRPVSGTEATVTVRKFEVLRAEGGALREAPLPGITTPPNGHQGLSKNQKRRK